MKRIHAWTLTFLLVGAGLGAVPGDLVAQQQAPSTNDPRLNEASDLFALGEAAAKAREFKKAIPLFEKALALRESAIGVTHRDLVPLINALGVAHMELRDHTKALAYLRRSLAIDEQVYGPEAANVGDDLVWVALVYGEMGQRSNALPLLHRALEIIEKTRGPEHPDVRFILKLLAGIYNEAGANAQALPLAQRSLAIAEKTLGPEDADVASGLNQVASIFMTMGEPAKALPYAQRCLAIYEKTLSPGHPNLANAISTLAVVYQSMGDYAMALPLHERGLALAEKALDPEDPQVAIALNNLATFYLTMGEYAKALPYALRSLAISEKMGGASHPSVGLAVSNIARIFYSMGEYDKAMPMYQRSIAILESAYGPDYPGLALQLEGLALLYHTMGEYGKIPPLYQRSLDINLKAFGPEHPLVAQSLNNLGTFFQATGDATKAMSLYERSVAIIEKALGPDDPVVVTELNNIAALHIQTGELAKALPLFERGLVILEKKFGPDYPGLTLLLTNIGDLHLNLGNSAKARPYYERSLALAEKSVGPNHLSFAAALGSLAILHKLTGDPGTALPMLERALTIANATHALEYSAGLQALLREVLRDLKQPDLAIFFGKQAVNAVQELRGRMSSLDRELQHSFLGNKELIYRGLADLLIEQGRLPEAQQVLAMLKEEEFFDFIRRDAKSDPRTTQTALTEQEEAWRKRYAEVSGRLAALGTELEELRRKARVGLNEAEQKRRTEVETDLRTARLAFEQFLGALMKEVESAGAARAREVGERGLANLRALQGTLGSIGPGVVALHYLMGEEKLRVILTTPSVQIAREANIGTKDLNRKIEQFRRVLQNPKSNPLPLAQELYALLIAPVAEDLKQAKAQTLMISLDGALRYVPLAALHDGKAYVVEQYRLAIFTEAAKDKLKDTPQAAWRLAGLGLTRQVEGFSALPAVRQELEGIIRTGNHGVLPGEAHFDQEFTAVRLRDALDKGFPVLHVASHFVFQPGTESNSFLLLGDGTRLTLREIKENDYDFRNVDLITLSACETAVGGGRDANGQEIEGFGALAQKQGARGVIATLWPVADESTGLLMQSLYRLREAEKLTKAEALRQAQLALIRGTQAAADGDTRGAGRVDAAPAAATGATYAHPYFWAPFILMGNWL